MWVGNTEDFTINNYHQLQSNNTVSNSSFYLSSKNEMATSVQWEFWIRLAFNPSSANYVDAYLSASALDLTLNTTSGYFVRIGNTEDEISLYRKDKNGVIIKIIDGKNGILNSANNVLKIKVTRDESNEWKLFRDVSGIGNSYINEGKVFDSTYNSSAYFGFLIKQSSSGFFQKHFFDDIEINKFVPDLSAPQILSATAISATKVDVLFNEAVDKISAELFSNYSANNGLGMPSQVILDVTDPALIHLGFNIPLTNGIDYTLIINDVKDVAGNAINNQSVSFSFYLPQHYDVIIDEIFSDPNPQVQLPLSKFIELKNTSAFPVLLSFVLLIQLLLMLLLERHWALLIFHY